MKILKIIHTMGHGGAENIFRWLASELQRLGIEVVAGIPKDIAPGKHENWIDPALAEFDVPRVYFDKSGNAVAMLNSMVQMIRKNHPDVVHSHLLDANFYSALACRKLGIPHISTEHGDIRIKRRLATRIKFALLPVLSTAVVCVSENLRNKAASMCLPHGARKLRTIYNGIVFPNRERSSFRAEQKIPDDALVIGNVGNLYPVKGQRFLIDAFARLVNIAPRAYLILVGRGAEEDQLRQRAADLGIAGDRIAFTGFRKDVANILNAMDIYVQPSLSEGFPVAVLEALSLNLPVIATAVGGVPEIITGRDIGILVPPGSSSSIFTALKTIIDAQESYAKPSPAAGALVREKFSVSQMAKEYLALYEMLWASEVTPTS